jgi:transposase
MKSRKKRHHLKKKVLFHQDNALWYKSIKMMAKLHKLGYELLFHPPYSSDLAFPCYFPYHNFVLNIRIRHIKNIQKLFENRCV